MISTTCHVASKFAITGILSLCFFREAVIRPAQRDRTVSAGRIVASGCLSTVILVMAAHRTASKILRGEIGISSASENPIGTGPTVTAPDRPVCIQDVPLLGPSQRPSSSFLLFQPISSPHVLDTPPSSCDNTTTDLPISSSPVPDSIPDITMDLPFSSIPVTTIDLFTSSTSVFPPSPPNITIIDLPDLANCNRLSLTSDTTLVSRDDDDLKFTDKASSTKEVESSGNERTFQEANERAPARAAHGCRVDTLSPITTVTKLRPLFLVNKFRTTTVPKLRPLFLVNKFRTTTVTKLRPLLLVNKFRTTTSHTITDQSLPGSTHLTNASLQTTKIANSLHKSPSLAPKDDFINVENVFTLPVVDQFQTASSTITNPSFPRPAHSTGANAPLPGFLRPANASSSLTGSARPIMIDANISPSGSAHPANILAQKTKAAASWLKPLTLVTKHAAGRPTPPLTGHQPEKAPPHKLKPQKPKPRASRSNAANRIVRHLALVCDDIRTDQADLMNVWAAAMAEVGLTSILADNHQTSLGSPFPPLADAVLVPQPGSRIKAHLASLRQRTNAVAATIPAATTTAPFSPWRRNS